MEDTNTRLNQIEERLGRLEEKHEDVLQVVAGLIDEARKTRDIATAARNTPIDLQTVERRLDGIVGGLGSIAQKLG